MVDTIGYIDGMEILFFYDVNQRIGTDSYIADHLRLAQCGGRMTGSHGPDMPGCLD